jgi:hypothetical protein
VESPAAAVDGQTRDAEDAVIFLALINTLINLPSTCVAIASASVPWAVRN